MKAISLASLALIGSVAAAQASDVRITVNSVRNDQGQLMVDLYDSEGQYQASEAKGGGGAYAARVPARTGTVTVVIRDVRAGTYGATVIHDENGDGELDTNFLGIPREGVGASNNARGRFGPPDYADMAFQVTDADTALSVDLDY